MTNENLVRASRDGDQFHYMWAARRCLLLLSPNANLKAITIEGASPSESDAADRITTGEEKIDVGEYYGSENLEHATLVRYIQVKHSTVRTDKDWTPSELEKTLAGFAKRYKELLFKFPALDLNSKLEFWFVSNRPINPAFLETVHDAAKGDPSRHPKEHKKLERFTDLKGPTLSTFCKLLHLDGMQEGLWDQNNILVQEVGNYLVDADIDAPVQLKELVTKKALSESADNPVITKIDVLRALKTDESRLFPAPCLIEEIKNLVPREQEKDFFQKIIQACSIPVIIHAAGGVGKSIYATRIKLGLPPGSECILYDCFGKGQYRNPSQFRHRHKDALVQIANELAALGLCHPLIPSPHADSSDYTKAFLFRLKQSIASLRSNEPQALLCIIIDAADNAQIAAEENGEERSFVRDLIREQLPEGVRLVALCRTHRQEKLNPTPETLSLELLPFSRDETVVYLRQVFADATEQDVDEFHRLSSQNPRVQALALSQKAHLSEILRSLGPNPTTVEDTIGMLLDNAISKLRDIVGTAEKTQIDRICVGLATLRPMIPLSVLAAMSEVDIAAIRSFAFDLGRPLYISGASVQFYDEPAETWFRDRFRPTAINLTCFIENLKPLAISSAYVASTLPQLMLEAGQFSELVVLALSSDGLPNKGPVEKRDVELQRLQFALKASLRAKRYTDAAKLALKAGGECAGDERQRRLLQTNTDLASVFLGSDRILELVSRRTFVDKGWVGSHHAYEAGLLSGQRELSGDARSRLRMSLEWLENWNRLPKEKRQQEEVSDGDIAEIATAFFNIHGADRCAYELRRWRPREISLRVGRIIASRFIDRGWYKDLDDLALAADNDVCLILAITLELRVVHRSTPKSVVERALRLVLNPRIKLNDDGHWSSEGNTIRAITALVEAALKLAVGSSDALISLLSRYLPQSPSRSLVSPYDRQRFPLLRAYALRAALSHQTLDLIDLAHIELRKELETPRPHTESREVREFKENIGALLPWHCLWAETLLGRVSATNLANTIAKTEEESKKADRYRYRDGSYISNEICRVWFDILLTSECADSALFDTFDQWIANLKHPLFTTTLTHLTKLAAQSPQLKSRALDYAGRAFNLIHDARENAESKSGGYVDLARAVLEASRHEATAYFNQAVEVASKIGDENLYRWEALLDLADRAASRNQPNPETAYRLARCAELTYEYVVRDKHFDWGGTVEAISGLCGKSSLTILSRWRDRDFGDVKRILPVVVNNLVVRGDLDPRIALALICFRAHWNEPLLLKSALSSFTNKSDKETASEFAYRYMSLKHQSAEKWCELKNISVEHRIDLPELGAWIDFNELDNQSSKSTENSYNKNSVANRESKDTHDWNAIFEGLDLISANDISRAHDRFKKYEPPYFLGRFFDEACRRVCVGREAEFIAAIAKITEFNLYDLRYFLESLPEIWKRRLAVKQTIAKTSKAFCRRFCMAITKDRYYEKFPLKLVCELSEISEDDLIDEVLSAIGEATEVASASRLFTLVGLLASNLTENDALKALSYGLDLFDPILKETDGDGPWSSRLNPPLEIECSVAGYIWGCLAAPQAILRWEAAHVVRALCTLGCEKTIGQLISFVNGAPADAFYDAKLPFYKLHACQWLLIGLARAAKEYPHLIVRYTDLLLNFAFADEPHVLIREFAKRTIVTLMESGLVEPRTELMQRLSMVNISPFTPVESMSYQRVPNSDNETECKADADIDEDQYYLGFDLSPYWFEPLARCFALSQADIQREVLRVIRRVWHFPKNRIWESDARRRRGIFKDGETGHSHGSYPRVDDFTFYLSYHAMMVTAGNLLATKPVHMDPDCSDDVFSNWLSRHDLTRKDGSWLSDRRDPVPLDKPTWNDMVEIKEWPWSISRQDFDRNLNDANGRINLWGHWTWISGQKEESISIRSALVSPKHSMALLRALQYAGNPDDYRIPDVDDELQIDAWGFQLKGWVDDQSLSKRLDQYDPWAGAIKYPPPTPSTYITDLMKVSSDAEHRRWYSQSDHVDVAWSQVWGRLHEENDYEINHDSGTRLQASFDFIVSLLQKLKMDMIVKVEIERSRYYSRWERSKDEEFGYIPPSARLFLIKPDASIRTL